MLSPATPPAEWPREMPEITRASSGSAIRQVDLNPMTNRITRMRTPTPTAIRNVSPELIAEASLYRSVPPQPFDHPGCRPLEPCLLYTSDAADEEDSVD